jgi:preprotein translocase subunit YajC
MILLQAQSGTASLIMFGLIFVVMYFFMIRPQIKKQKAENQYRASLKMGDKIITIGGVLGKIIEIGKSSVVIEVYGGSKLKVLKSAVSMSGESEIKTK